MAKNIKYLGNHAKRFYGVSDLQENHLYVVGRGANAFVAFWMPGNDQIDRRGVNNEITINGINRYEAILCDNGEKIEQGEVVNNSSLHLDEFMDFEQMGVFEPKKDSELEEKILEKMPKQTE